jgi:intracellular sulfur oxidation DsrE/DsrF family protein
MPERKSEALGLAVRLRLTGNLALGQICAALLIYAVQVVSPYTSICEQGAMEPYMNRNCKFSRHGMFFGQTRLFGWLAATVVFFLAAPGLVYAQSAERKTGPVIENYGAVFEVSDAWGLRNDVVYRTVKDVSTSPDAAEVNREIDSAARFLNMQVRAGVPRANLEVAVVLHGDAGKDALANEAYRARFGTDNPNDELLNALSQAGVAVYLCGQTAAGRGFQRSELHKSVTLAVSAMTVLTRLQAEGWSLLP